MIKLILNKAFISLISSSILRIVMLLVSIFIARYLGKESFGQYSLIRNTISMLETYTNYALVPTTTKYVAESQSKKNQIITAISIITLLTITILSLFLYFFSKYISNDFFNNSELYLPLLSSILILIGSTIMGIAISILVGFESYKIILKTTIISFIIGSPILIFSVLNFQLVGIIISIGIYFSIDALIKIVYIIKIHKFKPLFLNIFKNIKQILIFSFPLLLSALLIIPALWYSKIILLDFNYTFIDIAAFEAAFQWLTIILIITGAITNISLPIFSKIISTGTNKELNNALYINLLINLFISVSITFLIILFSKPIMLLYGDAFKDDDLLLILLTISSIFMSLNNLLNRYLISIEKKWPIFFTSFIWSLTFLILCFLLIPKYGAEGLSYSYLISYVISFLIYLSIFIRIRTTQ